MNILTPFLCDIEKILKSSKHPETELLHLVEATNEDDRRIVIIAMVGKLIEQNKRLTSYLQ